RPASLLQQGRGCCAGTNPAFAVLVGAIAHRHQTVYDEHHMRKVVARSKEATHERIVEAAARAIRRTGYDGTGVADIMKEAGLTHGGFYAHFPSREAMLAEAANRACAESAAAAAGVVASVPPGQALASMLRAYLSQEHLK